MIATGIQTSDSDFKRDLKSMAVFDVTLSFWKDWNLELREEVFQDCCPNQGMFDFRLLCLWTK